MQKTIGVTELKRRFRSVFDEVAQEQIPYILTRDSHPQAALIPYEAFLRFQSLQEEEVLYRFERLVKRMAEQNAAYDEDEIEADIEAARTEVNS